MGRGERGGENDTAQAVTVGIQVTWSVVAAVTVTTGASGAVGAAPSAKNKKKIVLDIFYCINITFINIEKKKGKKKNSLDRYLVL